MKENKNVLSIEEIKESGVRLPPEFIMGVRPLPKEIIELIKDPEGFSKKCEPLPGEDEGGWGKADKIL